jgi:hypothetical protein
MHNILIFLKMEQSEVIYLAQKQEDAGRTVAL